jgi:hypothetical protein
MNLDEVLYPGLLSLHWQMTHSERLGLCQLLQLIKPQVAVEVGTYKGGSLSAIARESGKVFSIDVDPAIPATFAHFTNTTFITEGSATSLPALLTRFEKEAVPLEFILIDGDHSAAGVRQDLNSVLRYNPVRDVYVLLHDSFNPQCRAGMLSADWLAAAHVAYAELDFIPGKVVQQGTHFDGQLWGGLALVVLSPTTIAGRPPFVTGDWTQKRCASSDIGGRAPAKPISVDPA